MDEVPLREHVEMLLVERDKRIDERWEQLAVRLEHLNELRANVISRGEYEAKHETLIHEVTTLMEKQAASSGQLRGHLTTLSVMLTMTNLAVIIVTFLLHFL